MQVIFSLLKLGGLIVYFGKGLELEFSVLHY